MIDYKTLISVVDKYSDEADRIFNKLHRADLEAKTCIIEYGKYATMERIEWEFSDENEISVSYYDHGYDLYCSCTINIPADITLPPISPKENLTLSSVPLHQSACAPKRILQSSFTYL